MPSDDVPEPKWRTEIHSQHFACDRCGRSFEPLTPHNFSFNSPLGWCPACEGLGTQTGANPAALVHDPKLSLAEGAIGLAGPAVEQRRCSPRCWRPCRRRPACRLDVPFEQLTARQRRVVLHGCGEEWIEVPNPRPPKHPAAQQEEGTARTPERRIAWFRFQYKGLYPALEEAARLSPALRGKLDHLVDEVECSTCGGSRLRDDAAAVRLASRTIDEICRLPLGDWSTELARWQWTTRRTERSPAN